MKKLIILLVLILFYHFNLFGNKLNISNKQLIHALDTNQVYTCSMHPEFISNKSGICPKCGMELILKKSDTKIYKGYTCSMHPEVVSNNPGNCPNCKMKLIEMRTVNPMSMGMMHNKMMHHNESNNGWMYITGGTLMILMMGLMLIL